MQVIRGRVLAPIKQSIVTIGNFDGLHLGHQQLIHAVVSLAKQRQLPSVLVTFEPHPSELFSPATPDARLMRFSEKCTAFQNMGIDIVLCLRFNARLAGLSPEDFFKTILVDQLGAQVIVIGDNFRFGARRTGDIAVLQTLGVRYGVTVQAIPQSLSEGERISSSRVRSALSSGDFKTVEVLLGKPFCLSGRVAYGSQMGRQLGYPTANIHLRRKVVPLMGIYIVSVQGLRDVALPGVASIGYRPTFGGKQILLEVHLFDFSEDIYGRRLSVLFLKKIREEQCFDCVSDLVRAIEQDVTIAKEYL